MATEKETREAIAAVIRLTVPDAIVIPRNQLGMLADGDFAALIPSGAPTANGVRGWVVTQSGADLVQQFSNYAEYRYSWRVVQVYSYQTGDDSTNSEDTFASDRAAVMLAFLDPSAVTGIDSDTVTNLGLIGALTFPQGSITVAPGREGGKRVHIADGTITAEVKLGANCE